MKRIFVTVVLCIVFLALGVLGRGMYDNYRASGGLTDEGRREHYLMPQKDSPSYKEWVAKYGDSADSWELFTLGFHTKYLGELNKRLTELEKPAKNQSIIEPNETRSVTQEATDS